MNCLKFSLAKLIYSVLLIILIFYGCDCCNKKENNGGEIQITEDSPKRIPITVMKQYGISITKNEVEEILAGASEILQTDNGDNDVSCNVEFYLEGSVNEYIDDFNIGEGVVDEPGVSASFHVKDVNIKIINGIRFCDNKSGDFWGCSLRGDNSVIVIRLTEEECGPSFLEYEKVLWAHELGHNTGLYDRPLDEISDALMEIVPDLANEKVNEFEKDKYIDHSFLLD